MQTKFREKMKHGWIFGLILVVAACQSNRQNDENALQEVRVEDGGVAEIIRNPASANEPTDTVNVAKMTFDETQYEYGIVDAGAIVEHTFAFTNTGKVPLVINDARSTCGCTVPEYPKKPIPPGESGEINVRFNTKGKFGQQIKPVTLMANTYPSETKVYLVGEVNNPDAPNIKH